MTDRPAILGVGMTAFSGYSEDRTIRELAEDAVNTALGDAGIAVHDVDLLVVAYESDAFCRQISLGQVLAGHLGLAGVPTLRVEGGGASGAAAIQVGSQAIEAGRADVVLVVGAETNGRGVDRATANDLLAMSADFDWETPIFGTFAVPYALMISEHMRRYGTTPEQFAAVAVKNRRLALDNPLAHRGMAIDIDDVRNSAPLAEPYRMFDASLLSDGAASIILVSSAGASEHGSNGHRPVHLRATGASSDLPRLADRPLEMLPHFAAKRTAARNAYTAAGIDRPLEQIDVAEVYDSFSGAEVQAYEDLAFCPTGDGGQAAADGRFDIDGLIPVNTSGGLIGRGSAVGATGIAQAVEVVQQLRGEVSGPRHVPHARVGLTDTHAGVGSLSIVHIYEGAA